MKKIRVPLGKNSYFIYIQAGLLSSIPAYLRDIHIGNTIVIITDENVDRYYASQLSKTLSQQDFHVHKFVMPAGEKYKIQSIVTQIYDWMLSQKINREVTIIACGGGVVGDLAGFVAATYMRGVRFVQIPTTFLAQVDSSVGGKVGINHELGKNVIGAFYQPKLVIIDPEVLTTLPERELYCGFAEVIKYSLIMDHHLFDELSTNSDKLFSLNDWLWIENLIVTCCSLKRNIVQQDEKEIGLRRILNFGHTIGHALESTTDYSYFNHGEAIAWGMLAATTMSLHKGFISVYDMNSITKLLKKIKKPPIPLSLTDKQLFNSIINDKKINDSGLNFIFLEKVGKAKIQVIDNDMLLAGINSMFQQA